MKRLWLAGLLMMGGCAGIENSIRKDLAGKVDKYFDQYAPYIEEKACDEILELIENARKDLKAIILKEAEPTR